MTEPLPKLPDRYQQVTPLRSNPIERTLRAYDERTQREVELRLPSVEACKGWSVGAKDRLRREALALAKLNRDDIQRIHDVVDTDEGLMIVQPPTEGELLADALQAGPMEPQRVLPLFLQLAEALHAIHHAGFLHRGIGPKAVWLLPNGKCRLGAFNYAKELEAGLGDPSIASFLQKASGDGAAAQWLPLYPAPELERRQKLDARADLFALGCLMFRCLTGADPVRSGDGMQMPDVRACRKDTPKGLAEVVRRCMLVERTARYPNALALAEALRPLQPQDGPRPAVAARPWLLATAAGAGLAVVLFALWPQDRGPTQTERDAAAMPRLDTAAAETFEAEYKKGHALLIGIGQAYDDKFHRKLNGPPKEIDAVADQLEDTQPGFWRITKLPEHEATKAKVLAAIQQLKSVAESNDAVLIYFAGHGAKKQGTARKFLVCCDANTEWDSQDKGYLDTAELNFRSGDDGKFDAKHVLVVADCCYSGKLFDFAGERGKTLPDEEEAVTSQYRHRLLASRTVEFLGSSSDEPAKDSAKDELSKFCQAFLAAWKPEQQDRLVFAVDIKNDLEKQFRNETQQVSGWTEGKGRFAFRVRAKR